MTESEWLTSVDPAAMLAHLEPNISDPDWARSRISDRKLRLWIEACRVRWPRAAGAFWLGNRTRLLQAVAQWSVTSQNAPAAEIAHLLRDIMGNPFCPVKLPYIPDRGRGRYHAFTPDGRLMRSLGGDKYEFADRCPYLTPEVLAIAQAAYEETGRVCETCRGDGYAGRLAGDDQYACAGCGRPAGMYGHYSERSKKLECPKCENCHGTGRIDDGTLDPQRLAVLADALEEAGCQEEALLRHLRGEEWGERVLGQGPFLGQDFGWRPLRGPHVRGCHVVSAILGKD